jgi:hypothetical protein
MLTGGSTAAPWSNAPNANTASEHATTANRSTALRPPVPRHFIEPITALMIECY